MRPPRLLLGLVLVVGLLTAGGLAGSTIVDLDGDGVPIADELRSDTDALEADTDGDGLDDGEEDRRGTDPTDADTDGDGLEDGAEIDEYETDPLAADTDGDGLEDGAEIDEYETDPLTVDTDGDGLEDGTEIREHETDPLAADTDGDGLEDGAEIREHETDPLAADTDGDGIEDGAESNEYETDPNDADTDDDGLEDGAEVEYGTNPRTADTDGDGLRDADERRQYGTDPTDADTDDDGLNDSAERTLHETDPTDVDTDGDGLDDGAEVHDHGTDPTDADTDGDGLEDGMEVHRQDRFPGADPLRTDIYVEVDTMERTELPRAEADRIAAKFENAPLENPDGSTGAKLHFVFDETLSWDAETDVSDLIGYRSRNFDRQLQGYHYMVIVEDVAGDTSTGNVIGKATTGTMMVESQSGRDRTGTTAMHELGHSLGLDHNAFEGVDSYRYGFERYTSVMNYNAPPDYYGFSSGGGDGDFDDWGFIGDNLFTPSTAGVTVEDSSH